MPEPGNRAGRGDDARRAHDLVNLVLAARLRLDAIRAATAGTPGATAELLDAIAPHLAAVDACLDRIVVISRTRDDPPR